jgi:hypothetical protein
VTPVGSETNHYPRSCSLWSVLSSFETAHFVDAGTLALTTAMRYQNRKQVKQEVLASADVICTTLSTSGRGMFRKLKFETVIIDEAGQAVELSLLIPLKYDCKRCIMVGDPQQLPATVISQVAMYVVIHLAFFH